MILVDTSVWVEHFRTGHEHLRSLLDVHEVAVHPMVVGELSMGRFAQREEALGLLASLPRSPVADHAEVSFFVECHKLHGTGLQFVDAHLLAATALMGDGRLWSADRRLVEAAERLNLAVA